ncbi:MAG TPA: hypothetical protein VGC15_10755 [Acetobacteraceae bacterium]
MWAALQNQCGALPAFAGVLDGKLAAIARAHGITQPIVRDACLLHRLPSTSPACWQGWNRLQAQIGGTFHALFAAVSRAMAQTPRSSSLVENLNSRLRTCFTLRRHRGGSCLDLLWFLRNHRRFLRSRHAGRQGKSPCELMTGQGHPHWLTLLGLGPPQHQRFSPSSRSACVRRRSSARTSGPACAPSRQQAAFPDSRRRGAAGRARAVNNLEAPGAPSGIGPSATSTLRAP